MLRIDEIPRSGRTIQVGLLSDEVASFLPEAYRIDGSRGGEVRGEVHLAGDYFHVNAILTVAAAFDCSRCAEPSRGDWKVRIGTLFVPAGRKGAKLAGDELDEERFDDVVEYQGRRIDLRPILEQALAVALAPFPVCSDDCAGVCPECGANRNLSACTCTSTKPVDSRWGPIADLLGSMNMKPNSNMDSKNEGERDGSSQKA